MSDDNEHLVFPEQGAIYVYTNDADAVVIRQGDQNDPEQSDHFVYIHRYNLPKLIEKLQTFVVES